MDLVEGQPTSDPAPFANMSKQSICRRGGAAAGPAGLLYPLHVPTRSSGCIGLDFIELPVARSGHDFLKGHTDLLTGLVWLVPWPTFKTATAETAARNFVSSVFRRVGSDRSAWSSVFRDVGLYAIRNETSIGGQLVILGF